MLWWVYIDEAGDRGISKKSSDHFVIAAVVVRDSFDATVRQELDTLRADLGRHQGHPLHFQKFSHSQRLKAIQDVAKFSIDTVTGVILCKRGFDAPDPAGDVAYITNPDPMYLWAVRLLLERVSWYIREHGGGSAVVTFAHVRHFKAEKLHNYRSALELTPDVQIHWPAFTGHEFNIGAPDKVELLQAADTSASAIFRAIEPDDYGNVERRYLEELRPKLYRRKAALVTSYGLKVFPESHCKPGAALAWLRDL